MFRNRVEDHLPSLNAPDPNLTLGCYASCSFGFGLPDPNFTFEEFCLHLDAPSLYIAFRSTFLFMDHGLTSHAKTQIIGPFAVTGVETASSRVRLYMMKRFRDFKRKIDFIFHWANYSVV
ncbi:hypothetical protein AAC387_Pa01g1804 [Persea americana]